MKASEQTSDPAQIERSRLFVLPLIATSAAVLVWINISYLAATVGALSFLLLGLWHFTRLSDYQAKISALHHQLQEKQREVESLLDRYRVLTDNLAAAIVIRNGNGAIAYCSPYTEVLTGYALDEIYAMAGDFFLQIIHEEDHEKYLRALKVAAQGEAFQLRYRFYHKTGIEMWAETRTVPVLDERGVVASSLSITLDITGLIRHQRQIEEKNQDLEDFSYMISHDLKAPLFTITGMLSMIKEDYGDTLAPGLKEALDHISAASKRLESLIAGVLEYSRISSQVNQEEPVLLSAVLEELKREMQPQLQSAQASLQIHGELPIVLGDRLKIYQIFSNLIGNAVKYRSAERALSIHISPLPSRTDRFTKISVADNGIGIPADKLELIFRPFQRAHTKGIEGSGIGLACVKKLLEKLGGEIEVKSREGEGSEFIVTLRSGWKYSTRKA